MSSSPTYTVVDQFDEDEFPDIPKAPAALLAALNTVPDPRKPRGLRHSLPGILAIAACAVIAGARSFVAIAEWAAAATPAALAKLGVTGEVPSESTIRRTINQIDANGLDLVIGAWTQCHVAKVDLAVCAGHRRGETRATGGTGVISGRGCCCVAESGSGDSRDAGRLGSAGRGGRRDRRLRGPGTTVGRQAARARDHVPDVGVGVVPR